MLRTQIIWKIFLIIILFSFLISCDKINSQYKYIKYITGDSISTNFDFMPIELLIGVDNPPKLKIKFVTTKIFSCFDYSLISTNFIKGNSFIIRFEKAVRPRYCSAAFGPAKSMIDLPENINQLVIINGNNIDIYDININKELISISSKKNKFTNCLYPQTFRYPKNTFVYICKNNLVNEYIYNDFLKILRDNHLFTEHYFEGDGRIPYPDRSTGHWSNYPSRFFRYKNESDFEKAKKLLDDFAKKNKEAKILLKNWKNRKYSVW